MARRIPLMLSALLTAFMVSQAAGALIAYEPFDYDPVGGDLLGRNGATGFSGPWRAGGFNASISNNYDISDDAMSFGQLLVTDHTIRTQAVGSIAGITRNLAAPLGQSDTTVYLSFLIQPEGTLHGGAFNGFLGLVLESAGEPELYIGKPGGGAIDRWVLEDRGGSKQHASSVPTAIGSTALLVIKAEYSAFGNDKFTLYVNPTPGEPEPATGIIKNDSNFGIVDGLTIYSTGAMRIDELRVGQTFFDVTPIPEPGTLGLLMASAVALSCAWKPRKRT